MHHPHPPNPTPLPARLAAATPRRPAPHLDNQCKQRTTQPTTPQVPRNTPAPDGNNAACSLARFQARAPPPPPSAFFRTNDAAPVCATGTMFSHASASQQAAEGGLSPAAFRVEMGGQCPCRNNVAPPPTHLEHIHSLNPPHPLAHLVVGAPPPLSRARPLACYRFASCCPLFLLPHRILPLWVPRCAIKHRSLQSSWSSVRRALWRQLSPHQTQTFSSFHCLLTSAIPCCPLCVTSICMLPNVTAPADAFRRDLGTAQWEPKSHRRLAREQQQLRLHDCKRRMHRSDA